MEKNETSGDPLSFIQDCVRNKRVLWTYHVNMRLTGRFISREIILNSLENYEIIKSYPEDRRFPSYLILSNIDDFVFHIVLAVDFSDKNIIIITAYRPDPEKWESDFKRRKKP